MTFTIPMWLIYAVGLAVGVPLLLVLLGLAWLGFVVSRAFGKGYK